LQRYLSLFGQQQQRHGGKLLRDRTDAENTVVRDRNVLLQIGGTVTLHQYRPAIFDHSDFKAGALARGDSRRRRFIDRCGKIVFVGRLSLYRGRQECRNNGSGDKTLE
jgi:hypothetical protein